MTVNLYLPRLRPDQYEVAVHPARFKIVSAGRRFGKALAVTTEIPTPLGMVRLMDLHPGDFVYGSDGRQVKILAETEVMRDRPGYIIEFRNGERVIADANHEWNIWSSRSGQRKTVTSDELYRIHNKSQRQDYYIPVALPTHNSHICLPIHPYLFGVWLGDGDSRSMTITTGDQDIVDRIEAIGYNVKRLNRACRYSITSPRGRCDSPSTMLACIRVKDNKHIPEEYLVADIEQRLELLRGLMDTDGTIGKRGNCTFYNSNLRLACQVRQLCASLGIKTSMTVRSPRPDNYEKNELYQVSFTTNLPVFHLPRKLARIPRQAVATNLRHYIKDMIPTKEGIPFKCIQVDSKDGLFLVTHSHIPTHNSFLGTDMGLVTAHLGGRCSWTVPTYKNARPIWRLAESFIAPLRQAGVVRADRQERLIHFPYRNGFLGIYSADNPDAQRGDSFHLAILDEASRIPRPVWEEVIQPTLADTNGDALAISTPLGRNWFWEEWERGQLPENELVIKSWKFPTTCNPLPQIRKMAELARDRVPERVYQQEWLAEFIPDGGLVFRNVSICTEKWEPEEPRPGGQYVVGVDIGKHRDYTVYTVLDVMNNKVVEVDRFSYTEYIIQAQRLKVLSDKWRPVVVLVERDKAGDGIIEQLIREGVPVAPFVTTNATKQAIIDHLSLAFERCVISIPPVASLVNELNQFEVTQTPSGLPKYGAPEGAHDDHVISLALAWYAGHELAQSPIAPFTETDEESEVLIQPNQRPVGFWGLSETESAYVEVVLREGKFHVLNIEALPIDAMSVTRHAFLRSPHVVGCDRNNYQQLRTAWEVFKVGLTNPDEMPYLRMVASRGAGKTAQERHQIESIQGPLSSGLITLAPGIKNNPAAWRGLHTIGSAVLNALAGAIDLVISNG